MLEQLIPRLLNHLLQSESWAMERLRPFAGAQALIETGIIDLHLAVDGAGCFVAGAAEQPPAVTITLPPGAPVKLLFDKKGVFQAARLSGSADFAETLAFVFRNLRWDAEADLARYLGDIPARRIEMARQHLFRQGSESASRLARNLAEYASEDSDWLAAPREIEAFGQAVDTLRDDVARLEKRLSRL